MAIGLGAAEASVFYLRGLAYQGLRNDAKAQADIATALRIDPAIEAAFHPHR